MDDRSQAENVQATGEARQGPAVRSVGPERPQDHVRNALQLLDGLQRLLLADPHLTHVLLDERLRLLAGARGRLWQAVDLLER